MGVDRDGRGKQDQRSGVKTIADDTFNLPTPLHTDDASVVESSIPIMVQPTRRDSRQAENAMFSTVAFSA